MAFGTFDILHEGHESFLKQAKVLGDYLLVIIARDKTVKQIKGEFPLHSESQRLNNLKKSGLANKVVLGCHDDKYRVIRKFRPNIIALGYDQMVFTQKLNKVLIDLNLDTAVHRMDAFFPQVYKSSLLRQKISESDVLEPHILQSNPIR